jgi:hypothetical protein
VQNHAISAPNVHPLPAIKPGHELVPAAIGRRGEHGQIVFIECPTAWCVVDHVAERQVALEDIVHSSYDAQNGGTEAEVVVESFMSSVAAFAMYASIQSDVGSHDPRLRGAHVVLDDGSQEDAFLTADMTEKLADDLIGFASQLRHIARTVRLANQATGDSDPDMDEALRRVRGGAA